MTRLNAIICKMGISVYRVSKITGVTHPTLVKYCFQEMKYGRVRVRNRIMAGLRLLHMPVQDVFRDAVVLFDMVDKPVWLVFRPAVLEEVSKLSGATVTALKDWGPQLVADFCMARQDHPKMVEAINEGLMFSLTNPYANEDKLPAPLVSGSMEDAEKAIKMLQGPHTDDGSFDIYMPLHKMDKAGDA